ncbi:MAG: hypothetical protein V3W34_12570, partial [Phycisphaerae bacterium]
LLDCQAGTAPVIDDGVACTDDSCDEVNDVVVNMPNNANCDNGVFCDGAETCDALLDCQVGSEPCPPESCDEIDDECACQNDTDCDDGLFCNGNETCDSAISTCRAGTPPVIDDGVACTDDSCDEVNDVVVNTPNDANCDNGLFCDGTETCDALLDCQAGTAPVIDDGVACTDDSCDEVNDVVVNMPNDANCDNGVFCDGAETCDALLDCQAGSEPCPSESCDEGNDECACVNDTDCDDDNPCTEDSCDEVTHTCEHLDDNGAFCGDGIFCTGIDRCVNGTCERTEACPGRACDEVTRTCRDCVSDADCDDRAGCTEDTCDTATGRCTRDADNAECDDELFCNGAETCNPLDPDADPSTGCVAGAAIICVDDGRSCTVEFCDEAIDSCSRDDSNCEPGPEPGPGPPEPQPVPPKPGTATGTVDPLGNVDVEVTSVDGETTAAVEISNGTTDQTVTLELLQNARGPGVDGIATFVGFAGNRALDVTLRVTTDLLRPGTFIAVVELVVQESALAALGMAVEDVALHVLNEAVDPPTWVLAGDNFVGALAPTAVQGDYGYQRNSDGTVTYWVVRNELSAFAVGQPALEDTIDCDNDGVPDDTESDTDGDGVIDDCDPCPADNPDDTDGDSVCDSTDICPGFDDNADADGDGVPDGCDPSPDGDDTVDDAVDTNGDGADDVSDPAAEETTPTADQPTPTRSPECGAAPCGSLGMLTLPMIMLGLVSMRRRVGYLSETRP